ncbi:unnamed protein product [Oikopleura dioica]|nr:unnamed protein product [Oikopleura dioica]
MVKVVRTRPCRREPAPGDSLSVFFTACSVFDGFLSLWGQMIELDDPYNEFKAKIEDVAQSVSSETSKKDFNDGDGCLLKYSFDQTWYRGRVMNKIYERKTAYRVHLIDYGNVEIVDQNSIKDIPHEISEEAYPPHACKFFLSGIHPTRNCWSIDAMHAAEKFSVYRAFTVNVVSVSEGRVYNIHSPEINSHLQS